MAIWRILGGLQPPASYAYANPKNSEGYGEELLDSISQGNWGWGSFKAIV